MTENKRFIINMEDECIDDSKEEIFIDFNDKIDFYKLCEFLNKLNDENEQLKSENQELSSIISAIEKGSCRSIDSFLDDYCTDEILKEFDLE